MSLHVKKKMAQTLVLLPIMFLAEGIRLVCKKKGREGHLAEKSQMIIIPSKSAFAF
jgi:hypothetical protein